MLRNSLTTGAADLSFGYGPPGAGWQPLTGCWYTGPEQAAPLTPGPSPARGEGAEDVPITKAVDQLDLTELVARELGGACTENDDGEQPAKLSLEGL